MASFTQHCHLFASWESMKKELCSRRWSGDYDRLPISKCEHFSFWFFCISGTGIRLSGTHQKPFLTEVFIEFSCSLKPYWIDLQAYTAIVKICVECNIRNYWWHAPFTNASKLSSHYNGKKPVLRLLRRERKSFHTFSEGFKLSIAHTV